MIYIFFVGFDVDYTCDGFDGGTALHIACINVSYDAAKVLLERGADVQFKNSLDLLPIGSCLLPQLIACNFLLFI